MLQLKIMHARVGSAFNQGPDKRVLKWVPAMVPQTLREGDKSTKSQPREILSSVSIRSFFPYHAPPHRSILALALRLSGPERGRTPADGPLLGRSRVEADAVGLGTVVDWG